jgi:hypothetical protein
VEQIRTSMEGGRMPAKVPLIGHLPIARQFHVLGILLVTFLVFAALIMAFDVRTGAQAAASTATATGNADAVAARFPAAPRWRAGPAGRVRRREGLPASGSRRTWTRC